MTNRFETMPIGIDDECGVVESVVLWPETRRAIVACARGECRFVERIDRGAVGRAETDMAVERGALRLGAAAASPEAAALASAAALARSCALAFGADFFGVSL